MTTNEGSLALTVPHRRRTLAGLRVALIALLMLACCGLCAYPLVAWSAHPSLYHDDFARVGSIRRLPLARAMVEPFNEHVAPLFVLVTDLAWRASGRRLVALPAACLAASYLAFAASAGLLGCLVRREARSTTAGLGAAAIFALSSVSAETVLWFSASSFQWALATTLAAWLAASHASDSTSMRGRAIWLSTCLVACLAAPAFSAIGLIAAPTASLRLLFTDRPVPLATRAARALIPIVGALVYLLFASFFRFHEVMGRSLGRTFDPASAALSTLLAPTMILLPYLAGRADLVFDIAPRLAAGITAALLLILTGWACRNREGRGLILGGLALIVGGYFLVYAGRAHDNVLWVLKVPRYHLFPQAGLICVLAGIMTPLSRWLDRGSVRRWLALAILAGALAPGQYPKMWRAAEGSYQFPDQPALLATAGRLESIARRERINLAQLIRALDPIDPRWCPSPGPIHPILLLLADGPARPHVPDAEVREILVAGLAPADRERIFGGMEATRYSSVGPLGEWDEPRLVRVEGLRDLGGGRYEAKTSGFLEYEIPQSCRDARDLALPGLRTTSRRPVEVWWDDGSGGWSEGRSVRWAEDRVVPLAALPHWRPGVAHRIRLLLPHPGEVTVGPPRFFR